MSDFISFAKDVGSTSLFQVIGMIVLLVFTFLFIGHKLFKLAFLFFIIFLAIFVLWLRGPMGEEMIEKFKGKRPPLFHMPSTEEKEKIKEQREMMRQLMKQNKE